MKGYSLDNNTIIINRDLTQLDIFLRDFLAILKKHSDYLVVSGYVSISSGRTRATEDIDVLFPVLNEKSFSDLFDALKKNGFWCYQGDETAEVFPYLKDMSSIRFARTNENFPNIELVPINETKRAKFFEFTHPQKITIKNFEFKIPPLEFEILYKEIVLAGDKDIADAKHLRTFFSKILQEKKFKEYEPIIKGELK